MATIKSPELEDTTIRDLLLVMLTVSTGAIDAISWLGLDKVFSAFMTGNLVFLGFRAGGADGPNVPRVLAAIAGFAIGAFLAGRLVGRGPANGGVWPRRVTLALAMALVAQVGFVIVWAAIDGAPSSAAGNVLIAVSAFAMGVQTAAVFALGVRGVFTTAVTATLAILVGDLADWSRAPDERRRLAAVLAALFAGALAGALLMVHARSWAPVFPLGVSGLAVVAAAGLFWRTP